jgi:hypothetical protein
MAKLLEKLSSYNLLNNLIPGSVFCFLLHSICFIDILSDSVVEILFIYYFVGMILSRIGSLVVEPIAEKTKLVSYADYGNYILASKIDSKIDILLETNNLYRTIAACGLVIIFVKLYTVAERYLQALSYAAPYVIAGLLLAIFLLSFGKQTNYIKKRVENVVQDKKKEENEPDRKIL